MVASIISSEVFVSEYELEKTAKVCEVVIFEGVEGGGGLVGSGSKGVAIKVWYLVGFKRVLY